MQSFGNAPVEAGSFYTCMRLQFSRGAASMAAALVYYLLYRLSIAANLQVEKLGVLFLPVRRGSFTANLEVTLVRLGGVDAPVLHRRGAELPFEYAMQIIGAGKSVADRQLLDRFGALFELAAHVA